MKTFLSKFKNGFLAALILGMLFQTTSLGHIIDFQNAYASGTSVFYAQTATGSNTQLKDNVTDKPDDLYAKMLTETHTLTGSKFDVVGKSELISKVEMFVEYHTNNVENYTDDKIKVNHNKNNSEEILENANASTDKQLSLEITKSDNSPWTWNDISETEISISFVQINDSTDNIDLYVDSIWLKVTTDSEKPIIKNLSFVQDDDDTKTLEEISGKYFLETTGDETKANHTLDFGTETKASEELNSSLYEINLIEDDEDVKDELKSYYNTNSSGDYQTYLKKAVDGDEPFAYLKVNNSTKNLDLLDAAQYNLVPRETAMEIPDNYPEGAYTLKTTITDTAGNETTYTWKLLIDRTDPSLDENKDIKLGNGTGQTEDKDIKISIDHPSDTTKIYVSESNSGFQTTTATTPKEFSATGIQTTINWALSSGFGTKTLYIQLEDAVGNISKVYSKSICLVDLTAPEKPANFKADQITKNAVKLTWDKVVDANKYTIRYRKSTSDDSAVSYTYEENLTNTEFLISSLDENTEYEFGISATDKSGNESKYAVVNATTLEEVITEESTTDEENTASEESKEEVKVETASYAYSTYTAPVATEEVSDDNTKDEDTEDKGIVKSDEDEDGDSQSARTAVTLGIIIIAIGAALGGYYGYQWWLSEGETKEEPVAKEKKTPKKKSKRKSRRW